MTASAFNTSSDVPSFDRVQPSGADSGKRSAFAWLRQPLIHFLIAGFALFVIYGGLHGSSSGNDARRIEITRDDEIVLRAKKMDFPAEDDRAGRRHQ